MASYRPESVGKAIQVAMSEILRTETRDPLLAQVTVTQVKMSRDLRSAKIYFSVFEKEAVPEKVLEGLNRALPFLRREIAQRVRLRQVPELFFSYDNSMARGSRIDELLNQLKT